MFSTRTTVRSALITIGIIALTVIAILAVQSDNKSSDSAIQQPFSARPLNAKEKKIFANYETPGVRHMLGPKRVRKVCSKSNKTETAYISYPNAQYLAVRINCK